MKLAAYLASKDLTLAEFSARVGCDISWTSRIARELELPRWPLMLAILRETRGRVKPNDFIREQDRDER